MIASAVSAGSAARSPPLVWGSWASVTSSGDTEGPSASSAATKRRLCAAPPVSTPARASSSAPSSDRQGGRIEHELYARRPRHLQPVAEQAEAGHVGRAPDASLDEDLGRGPIQPPHLGDRRGEVVRLRAALRAPETSRPVPSRFVRIEDVADPRPALAEEPVGMADPDHGEAVLRLRVADRVAAREDSAGLAHGRGRPREDRRHGVARQILRERGHGHREEDASAHREDVRHGIGGRDRAVGLRVVHERREEVDRADDRDLVAQAVDSGVVGRRETGQQVVGRLAARRARRAPRRARPRRASRRSPRTRSAG